MVQGLARVPLGPQSVHTGQALHARSARAVLVIRVGHHERAEEPRRVGMGRAVVEQIPWESDETRRGEKTEWGGLVMADCDC